MFGKRQLTSLLIALALVINAFPFAAADEEVSIAQLISPPPETELTLGTQESPGGMPQVTPTPVPVPTLPDKMKAATNPGSTAWEIASPSRLIRRNTR